MIYYIYKIENQINHKVYIGQTKDFHRRKLEHIRMLKANNHENLLIKTDCLKYGNNVFIFKILEQVRTRAEALDRETYWINYYGGIEANITYNMQDKYTANKLMRELISKGQTGKIILEETKLKISKTEKEFYQKNPAKKTFLGKHHTEASKKKMSEARKGKPLSKEHRLAIGIGNKGKKVSDNTKKKMSEIMINKHIRKYSIEFVEQLRKEYKELGTYRQVLELHPELNATTVGSLIRNGTPNPNYKYKSATTIENNK